jgi:hypothetical protein
VLKAFRLAPRRLPRCSAMRGPTFAAPRCSRRSLLAFIVVVVLDAFRCGSGGGGANSQTRAIYGDARRNTAAGVANASGGYRTGGGSFGGFSTGGGHK